MLADTVQVITEFRAFLEMEAYWNRLVDAAGIDHPFVRHEWIRTWWECFGKGDELRILIVREQGAPVGIVPLMLCRRRLLGAPVRQLQFIWNIHAPRSGMIVGRDAAAVCRAALAHIGRQRDWDVLVLPRLAERSHGLVELPLLANEQGMRTGLKREEESPYLPITTSWDAYWNSLDAKHRSNLRNREKRLCKAGKLALEVVSSVDDLDGALEDGFRLEAAAWKGAAGSAITSSEQTRRFYADLARRSAALGTLRLCFLNLNGQRIAVRYALETGNKLYVLKSGYDPSYATCSPSNVLLEFMLKDAFRRGVGEVDFVGTAESWKRLWTPNLRPHHALYVFPDGLAPRALHWMRFRFMPALGRIRALRGLRNALRPHGDGSERKVADRPAR